MTDTLSPELLFNLFRRRGLAPRKSLGQHFLVDGSILNRLAEATQADAKTLVVEIGPGPATLTTLLARRAGAVVAVERDERLRDFHERAFGADPRVEFRYEDALRVDLQAIARERMESRDLAGAVLAGNLPFQITSPLLFNQTGPDRPWRRMVLTVQREVADRVTAPPDCADYGILTVKLSYWWRAVDRFEIAAGRFHPPPKVDASALVLEPTPTVGRPSDGEWPSLSRFIDLAFNQRRKKLYNSPAAAAAPDGKERTREALREIGKSPDARAEALSPGELRRVHELLKES
jgi:16S rRNA (adenine1518-N6/adenine1519-N6)-dimethyltransferase